MIPPIFPTVRAAEAVTALLGTDPTRFFLFGMAPQGTARPYGVWQVVGGEPENFLHGRPDLDSFTLQVDVYADDPLQARLVSDALRDAIEPVAHITGWMGESQDPETNNWRSTFRVDWFTQR